MLLQVCNIGFLNSIHYHQCFSDVIILSLSVINCVYYTRASPLSIKLFFRVSLMRSFCSIQFMTTGLYFEDGAVMYAVQISGIQSLYYCRNLSVVQITYHDKICILNLTMLNVKTFKNLNMSIGKYGNFCNFVVLHDCVLLSNKRERSNYSI